MSKKGQIYRKHSSELKTTVYNGYAREPFRFERNRKEDLIAENQRLRMEIEHLKKLSALVLAEERKNGKKQK